MILRPDHSLDKNFKSFGIVKFKGMGSIIQAGPMLSTIRMNYPESRIYFITSVQNRAIVEKIDEIDEVIYLNDRDFLSLLFGLPVFIFKLIRKRIDVLFDLEVYSNISSILSTFSCARNRFGYYRSASQYRMGLYTHMMFFNSSMPLSQCYLQMIRALPIKDELTDLRPFDPQGPGGTADFIDQSRPLVLVNPNASDLRIERRWVEKKFAELIDEIRREYPEYQVALIGGKGEQDYVAEVINHAAYDKESLINLSGKTNIDELIWLLSTATLFISSDTGPAHLAYSQQCPSIILFGPVNPVQFEIPDNVRVMYKNLYCSPCVHEFDVPPCHGDNQCMKLISVKEVFNEVKSVLNEIGNGMENQQKQRFLGENGSVLGRVIRKKNR